MTNATTKLVLASASPRRKELLQQIGVDFQIAPVDICEDVHEGEHAETYVKRLALEKAQVCLAQREYPCTVLGSDTTVVCDGVILGKPADEDDAVAMLLRLSGKKHQVMTAVAVVNAEQSLCSVVITEVQFKPLSEAECRRYWATGEPADKAGAYGIQGLGAVFVEHMSGSYSAVVGLPLKETAELLHKVGIEIWQV